MQLNKLMAQTIEALEKMEEEPLRKFWADCRDLCNQRDQPRRLWNEADERDSEYYHLRMMQAVALVILLGKWQMGTFSMSDVRGAALEYFERANQAPLNGQQPRRFLEFLLSFKRAYPALENELDELLLDIVDRYPDLGQHNFQPDPQWYRDFFGFAMGLRHRSKVYMHGEPVPHYQLAEKMKDLYYDSLAGLLEELASGIDDDAEADRGRGRPRLASALEESAAHLRRASESLQQAWAYCEPHVDKIRKAYGMEHIFDTEEVRKARIGQRVHSYMLTLRMHGETADEPVHLLSLLEGMDYHSELAKDPDFEAFIDALIGALEIWSDQGAAEIERELNALIQRDVWSCDENMAAP